MMKSWVGSEIAGYQVLEEIGGRGGSQTFKAVAPDGERLVVIKLFPAEVSKNRQLFLELRNSMRAVFKMDHPSIPPIIGSGTTNGRPYILTSYIEAGSLLDRYERGTLAALDVEHTVIQIASVLEYAHSRGVFHGNLKPSNILFGEDGQAKIVDFGQAPILQNFLVSDHDYDQVYQAPESLKKAGVTAVSDQYSLGIIAIEMLTYLPAEDALRIIRGHQQSDVAYRALAGRSSTSLSLKVFEVLYRAISTNPADRFPSMAEMARALQVALELTTAPTAEVKPTPKEAPIPKRRKGRPIIVVASSIAMVLCLIFTYPALSSAFKGITQDILPDKQSTLLVQDPNNHQSSVVPSLNDKVEEITVDGSPEVSQDSSGENSQYTEDERMKPSATEDGSQGTSPQATKVASATQTTEWTATSESTHTPSTEPTATLVASDTPPPLPTPTQETPPPPPPDPTINPNACTDKPGKKHYCTPTSAP